MFLLPKISFSQEIVPLKLIRFSIDVNQLKTTEQVESILTEMNNLSGIRDCELILTNYLLEFTCSNYDLKEYQLVEKTKLILNNLGVSIKFINRKTISNGK